MKQEVRRICTIVAIAAKLALGTACNHSAPQDQNASVTDQEAPEVKTPAGGGTDPTNKRSVPERPPAAQNTRMGSAVPPAAADETRPHPRQQEATH